jgi:tRNA-2-methylthio-N6-dimethylallyladenosine synthase
VSIMQGCEMECAFCIVPQTRGSERSRPITEIVGETRDVVANGVKEITLLGQIVTSYGRGTIPRRAGRTPFVQLLEALDRVDGLERVRFASPHPKGFGTDLVGAFGRLGKLCEHAHLPVQSGSNRILRIMRRGYTRESYLRIVDALRAARPGIAITTDIIVGFPGESAEDFEQTRTLMAEVGFDQAYIFKYSKRHDTVAAGLSDQVAESVKEERNEVLLELLNNGMLSRHQGMIGSAVEILVEGPSTRNSRRLFGRTRTNKGVVFEGQSRHRGQLLPIRIEEATVTTLYGTPVIHGVSTTHNGEEE